ncbi:hypothetical protein GEMRC1_003826 [Eukaryota sp. GEM-RC1]
MTKTSSILDLHLTDVVAADRVPDGGSNLIASLNDFTAFVLKQKIFVAYTQQSLQLQTKIKDFQGSIIDVVLLNGSQPDSCILCFTTDTCHLHIYQINKGQAPSKAKKSKLNKLTLIATCLYSFNTSSELQSSLRLLTRTFLQVSDTGSLWLFSGSFLFKLDVISLISTSASTSGESPLPLCRFPSTLESATSPVLSRFHCPSTIQSVCYCPTSSLITITSSSDGVFLLNCTLEVVQQLPSINSLSVLQINHSTFLSVNHSSIELLYVTIDSISLISQHSINFDYNHLSIDSRDDVVLLSDNDQCLFLGLSDSRIVSDLVFNNDGHDGFYFYCVIEKPTDHGIIISKCCLPLSSLFDDVTVADDVAVDDVTVADDVADVDVDTKDVHQMNECGGNVVEYSVSNDDVIGDVSMGGADVMVDIITNRLAQHLPNLIESAIVQSVSRGLNQTLPPITQSMSSITQSLSSATSRTTALSRTLTSHIEALTANIKIFYAHLNTSTAELAQDLKPKLSKIVSKYCVGIPIFLVFHLS